MKKDKTFSKNNNQMLNDFYDVAYNEGYQKGRHDMKDEIIKSIKYLMESGHDVLRRNIADNCRACDVLYHLLKELEGGK